ncbi:titin homolog isoform X2 [Pecten maximus]|uniref:titin homolog isoform X2 n=1 Tax=Pecten maximus TaxID=6579 RepID=UPI001458C02C|nr:titin homolog isoform X2 [Pecten maximus]
MSFFSNLQNNIYQHESDGKKTGSLEQNMPEAAGKLRHNTDDKLHHNTDDKLHHNTDDKLRHNTDDKLRHNTDGKLHHNTDDKLHHFTDDKLRHNTDGPNVKHPRSGEGEHGNDQFVQFPSLNIPENQVRDEKGENKVKNKPTEILLNPGALTQDEVKETHDLSRKAFGGHDPNSMIKVGAFREMETQATAMSGDQEKNSNGIQTEAYGGHDPNSVIRIGACRGMVTTSQEILNSMKKENQEMKDQLKCKVCRAKHADIAFIPCGHLVCCSDCSQNTVQCMLCKGKIETRVPITDDEQ